MTRAFNFAKPTCCTCDGESPEQSSVAGAAHAKIHDYNCSRNIKKFDVKRKKLIWVFVCAVARRRKQGGSFQAADDGGGNCAGDRPQPHLPVL